MTTGSRNSLGTSEGSLGTYLESTQKGNDEILEQSPVQAGETRRSSVQIRTAPPQLINLLIKMDKDGTYSKYTIRQVSKSLGLTAKHADLNNPEEVKYFISHRQISEGSKRILAMAYTKYARFTQIQCDMPKYHETQKQIRLPTKERVEMLIATAKQPLSIKLQISAETGLRPIEVYRIHAKDIDTEKRLLYMDNTAKHGSSRTLKISQKLTDILREYIHKQNKQPNDTIFTGDHEEYSKNYREMRNRLASKLKDPMIKTIRLYDLRHYFATMLYAKTRDILYVKNQMGHKNIDTTLIYTQLLNLDTDEWTVKTATDIKQATELLEAGFEYIQDIDGTKLYRKRK